MIVILTRSFDAIVCDVEMPNLDGLNLTARVRQNPMYKGIPIVLCTSKGNDSDKFWGQQQGANGHVVKPFKSDELLLAVKRALG